MFGLNSSYSKRPYREAYYFNVSARKDSWTIYDGAREPKASSRVDIGASLKYKSLLRMLYAILSATYSMMQLHYIMDYTYSSELTTASFPPFSHKRHSLNANLSLDKTFSDAKLAFKTIVGYGGSKFAISQNESLVDNLSNTFNYSFDVILSKKVG